MGIMNYYHFTVVSGFFIGVFTALINIERGPLVFTAICLSVSVFFYFVVHVAISLFIRYSEEANLSFKKDDYEKAIDHYYNELLTKEKDIDDSYEFTKQLEDEMRELYVKKTAKKRRKKRRVSNA
ncbi:MAG: hypothetical protein ACQERK_03035 [Campylobacterota bacterium]